MADIRRIKFVAVALALLGVQLIARPATAATSDGVWDYQDVSVSGTYRPFVGYFNDDNAAEVFWYGPGSATDTLWLANDDTRTPTKKRFDIGGDFTPLVGDFGGDENDDIFWYSPGSAIDRLWISDGSADVFDTSRVFSVDGNTYKPRVVHDYRAGHKDRIFWWIPGSGGPMWTFDADGNKTSYHFTVWNDAILPGDWNGDGVEDLILYTPGPSQDWIWLADGRVFRPYKLSINGSYQLATVYQVTYDEIFFFGTGDKPDSYWHNTQTGFHPQRINVSARGKPLSLPFFGAVIYNPVGGDQVVFDNGGATTFVEALSPTRDVGAGKIVLTGDFDGDGFMDLIFYGPGTGADAVWYGHNTDAGVITQPQLKGRT